MADNASLMKTVKPVDVAALPGASLLPSKQRWKPNVTVAAVVEREGRFLLVEEQTSDGLLLNNPAGHLDEGESPLQAVVRETFEETACHLTVDAFLGIFMSRFRRTRTGADTTYMRLAFVGHVSDAVVGQALDEGIVRVVWMTVDEIRAQPHRMRSPLVLECIEHYLAGVRFPLSTLLIHDSVYASPPEAVRSA